MMEILRDRTKLAGALAVMLSLTITAGAVNDGLGTNHTGVLRAQGLELDGKMRTSWPVETGSAGGTLDFRANSNQVMWTAIFRLDGQLETARLQTDEGEADALIIRSKWNDAWNTYTVINTLKVTTNGIADNTWSSSWISNSYRIGVIVTNFTTGTNLWWSVDYTE